MGVTTDISQKKEITRFSEELECVKELLAEKSGALTYLNSEACKDLVRLY